MLAKVLTMARFENAVIEALGTLPPKCIQRIDGLMCEHPVLSLPDHAKMFSRLRLWILERRGVIESRRVGSFWPSCDGMKAYSLKS